MAVVATPAGAQEQSTEVPTEAPAAAEPLLVTGRDALVLPLPAQTTPISATVTDKGGETATWTIEPPAADAADATPYRLDVEAPGEGAAPVNGVATLTVTAGETTLLDVALTLDRDPAAPTVSVVNRFGNVTLLWDRISGPGSVTYRVQRATADGEWSTLSGAAPQLRFTDFDVDPGRYRYRVNALVPAARAGFNFSAESLVTVRVVQQKAPPAPQPPAEETVEPPAVPQRPKAPRAEPRRKVAATGEIRTPVVERRVRRGSPSAPTLQPLRWNPRTVQRLAGGPAIAPPRMPADDAPVAAPPLARFVQPPIALPPAGTLAIEAANANGIPPVAPASWLAAAALAGMLLVSVRRRDAELSLAPDGRR